jgi:hypothetical protein
MYYNYLEIRCTMCIWPPPNHTSSEVKDQCRAKKRPNRPPCLLVLILHDDIIKSCVSTHALNMLAPCKGFRDIPLHCRLQGEVLFNL